MGSDVSRKESQKPAIPIGQLSRFENEQFSGRFTNVWRGSWLVDGKSRVSVAIKQLKKEHEVSAVKVMQIVPCVQSAYHFLEDKVMGSQPAVH